MITILELKEKIRNIYGKYDRYIVPAAKFFLALFSIMMLNISMGYMSKIKNPLIAVAIALLCAFLPNGFTIVLVSLFMLGHLYAVSAELAVVALCIFLIMYLLYFRFTPKLSYVLIITTILCWMRIPYLIPVVVGLTCGAVSIVPVSFGVIVYSIISTASNYETAITTASNSMAKFSFIVESILDSNTLIINLVALLLSILVVYAIKRLSIENAWLYAICSGIGTEFIIFIAGKMLFSAKVDMLLLIVGCVIAFIIGYVLQIIFFNVDYKRTEYVQYEDDDYYYYVKAVPKVNLVNSDVKVKKINAQKAKKTDDIKAVNARRKTEKNTEE